MKTFRQGVCLSIVAALGLAGCAGAPTPPEAPAAQVPMVPVAPEPEPPVAIARPLRSSATTAADYKVEVAERIHAAIGDGIYEGAPPPILRSIVVLTLAIDREGQLVEARVIRDNGDAEAVRTALESARRAAPFPAPPARVVGRGRVSFYETWLFRDDGRFRLRSLAQVQQSGD